MVTRVANGERPAGPRGGRIAFLDTLRFLAAAAVVGQHLIEIQHGPVADAFVRLGPGVFGVALFFIISGFVIPFSVKRGFDPRSFAIRRVFRIYPLALVSFLAAWVMGRAGFAAFHAAAVGTPADWLANLLLIHEYVGAPAFNGVTWTLPIELAWYATFAAALMLFRARAGHVLAIAMPSLFVLLALASLVSGHRLPLGRIGMFYAAVIGFQCCRHFEGEISARRLVADALLFLGIMAAGNAIAFGYFHHPHITMMQAMGPWFFASAIFLSVYAVPRIRTARLLASPVLAGLGAISYSTYLLHPFAIAIAGRLFATGPAMNVVALVLTLLASIAGYRLVERPGMLLGSRIARRQAPQGRVQPA